jgi:AhpD family alkylhydroperoxidase
MTTVRRASDESSIDYTKCSGSAPRDVSARALHPLLRPGGIAGPLGEDARASQINGCAFCLDLHSKDARALGETEQRLYVLGACEEAPFYSERERAALALTDAVTRIPEGHLPDAVFERARAHFNGQELVALGLP